MACRFSFFIAAVFFATACVAEERVAEDPPLPPADFYFSGKDPHLAETERVLADAMKLMPQIRINRVPIDDPKGYEAMSKAEKDLGIKEPGEMLMAFGPFYLTSKGERRDIEAYFVPM